MKKIIPTLIACLAFIFLVTGCKSPSVISDKVKDDEVEESVSAYRSVIVEVQTRAEETQPVTEEELPAIEDIQAVIEDVQPAIEEVQPIAEDVRISRPDPEPITGYYSVQVGAFTDALNADNALRKIRQRFDLEARSDFDSVEQLYKITVGRFDVYEDAQTFRDRIIRDYPYDYIDAWIVDMELRNHRNIR